MSRHHVFPDEASTTFAARVWLDVQVSVPMTLEIALVFELLATKLTAVELSVLSVHRRQVARQCGFPSEHFPAQLTLQQNDKSSKGGRLMLWPWAKVLKQKFVKGILLCSIGAIAARIFGTFSKEDLLLEKVFCFP